MERGTGGEVGEPAAYVAGSKEKLYGPGI